MRRNYKCRSQKFVDRRVANTCADCLGRGREGGVSGDWETASRRDAGQLATPRLLGLSLFFIREVAKREIDV